MLLAIAAAGAGYVASIYTWPAIRTFCIGAEAEIAALRARIAKL